MKYRALFVLFFFCSHITGQEDYTININDTALKISLDKRYELIVNGKKLVFLVSSNDTLAYDDNVINFQYPKGFNVSRAKLEDGIEQIMIVSADGSGIVVQKYSTVNPSMLNEMMLSEVTKESINYGYILKREDYQKTIKTGQKINVNKAVLKYKDEVNIYEVASIGKKDEGILIMTMKMDNDKNSSGQKLIDLMWATLALK
jgi:hypothetical protein